MTKLALQSGSGGITYVQYLQREIQDRIDGVYTDCGPPIVDYPTLREWIFPGSRPNHEVEARLEAQLKQVEAELERERELTL